MARVLTGFYIAVPRLTISLLSSSIKVRYLTADETHGSFVGVFLPGGAVLIAVQMSITLIESKEQRNANSQGERKS